ncbi:hypothetical protein V1477_009730 [Vespula maculifrons]|uniref:Uncharacterized protein n=1 Tax=Vespula maculifrons TaxID=7453 RepID=A0ABD2CAK9_VESMC
MDFIGLGDDGGETAVGQLAARATNLWGLLSRRRRRRRLRQRRQRRRRCNYIIREIEREKKRERDI